MKKIGLIGAMEEEVAILKEQMNEKTEQTKAGMTFIQGNLWGTDTVLVVSGIGKTVNVDAVQRHEHLFITTVMNIDLQS